MLIYTKIPSRRKVKGKRRAKKPFTEYKPKENTRYRADDHSQYPSHIESFLEKTEPKKVISEKYEGEMADREAAAQAETRRKAKTLAPAYNKGPYQPVTSEEQAKWIGRK